MERQMELRVERAWLPDGLARGVRIEVGEDGRIARIERDLPPSTGRFGKGLLVPGMPNLHSHAFQRAMAGAAEVAAGAKGSFWGWRELMYRLVERLTPADVAAIGAFVYAEMLEAGYTSVGEFHYLHHRPGGKRYAPATRLADSLRAAALKTGIRQVLLPCLYQQGNFGGVGLSEAQKRFGYRTEDFMRMVETLVVGDTPTCSTGIALHSLRAVSAEALHTLAAFARRGARPLPLHIHVAEQVREVQECLVAHGRRPVEFLLESGELGAHWCLVHATHVTATELSGMAASGAVLGLCPTTEANLGDGRFPLDEFKAHGGGFGVGSDSQVSIDPREELRLAEYNLRLWREQRVLATDDTAPHLGAALWSAAVRGGAQALGLAGAGLEVGAVADMVLIDTDRAGYAGVPEEALLDAFVFAPRPQTIDTVWVAGVPVVNRGRHPGRARIERNYRQALKRLMSAV
jgi:formiminoglutamate deiminase